MTLDDLIRHTIHHNQWPGYTHFTFAVHVRNVMFVGAIPVKDVGR